MLFSLLFLLLLVLLFLAAVPVFAAVRDEHRAARRPAAFLLAAFLLAAVAIITYRFAPLWLQLSFLALTLLGTRTLGPLNTYRWLLSPFAILAARANSLLATWSAALLILATVAAATLFATGTKRAAWHQHLRAATVWLLPRVLGLALFTWIFLRAF